MFGAALLSAAQGAFTIAAKIAFSAGSAMLLLAAIIAVAAFWKIKMHR
jgi:hypothetical protein